MIAIVLFLLSGPFAGAATFTWQELPGGRFELRENGKPVLTYNYGVQLPAGVPEDRRRCCYIFPVLTPAGVSLLDDFPKDHYHHHGLFWGWPVVETRGERYDSWAIKGMEVRAEKWLERPRGGATASFRVLNGWYAGDRRIIAETVSITVRKVGDFDVNLEFEAVDAPVTLAGAVEPGKAYGGFNARFAPRTGTAIATESGPVAKDEDRVVHPWAELRALYNGRPATLRITPAPGLDYQWCLRNYGFLGASYPGRSPARESVTLEKGKPLRMRFTVTVSD